MSILRYCGRQFSEQEMTVIQTLIKANPEQRRAGLSRLVCDQLNWRSPNGQLKEMSCRVAMLRMQDDGLIRLPPPRNGNNNGKPYLRRTIQAEPELTPLVTTVAALPDLRLEKVTRRSQSHQWNEYIDRYHYLGYQPLPGAQLRYFAKANDQVLACLGFGAAAWTTAPRDNFIGWSHKQREDNLHLVVNNARFLVLPWVQCKNLASRLLSMAARRLASDWQQTYQYRPVLIETFIERRFHGTCYKAANWQFCGYTQGLGKLGRKANLPVKSVWVYPIAKKFRDYLCP
jgi:hypothetical protein